MQFIHTQGVLTFKSVNEISKCHHYKPLEQQFPVVLFTMLVKVVLTFESVDEILICDTASETLFRKCFQFGALPT